MEDYCSGKMGRLSLGDVLGGVIANEHRMERSRAGRVFIGIKIIGSAKLKHAG